MSTLSELALQVHRMIWYPLYVALGLESRGVILPQEFAPSLSEPGLDRVPCQRHEPPRRHSNKVRTG